LTGLFVYAALVSVNAMDPQRQLQTVGDIQLGKYRAQMGFDGSFRDVAIGCNYLV
jgi:hypothetical protein